MARLDIRIEGGAKRALARLSVYQGASQQEVLTELLLKAERDVLATLDKSSQSAFMACQSVKTITG